MIVFSVFKILVFCFLLYLLGYYFVYNIVKKLIRRRHIRTDGEKALATISDYKITKDSDGVKSFYPVLQFKTKSGETVTVNSLKRRGSKYKDNTRLTVYYLPNDPNKFYISGLVPFIKLAGLILGFSGACLLIYELIKTAIKLFEAI